MSESVEEMQVRHVISADGSSIGWRQFGSGPVIVMVHGSLATGDEWLPVANHLAKDYTIFLVDRRGRGLSGDAEEYTLETEVADLRAVLSAAGPGAALLGHSYGAVCAAATAAAGVDLSALVLYEPPLPVSAAWDTTGLSQAVAAVRQKDYEQALTLFLSLLLVPDDVIARLRATPVWARMAALTPTFEREYDLLMGLARDLDRFLTIEDRTLFFLGGDSPQRRIDVMEFLVNGLTDVTVFRLPGQQHYAHLAIPQVMSDAVRSFLQGPRTAR
jgi:pimeloyl-ACP methyl ester carboxylesterase